MKSILSKKCCDKKPLPYPKLMINGHSENIGLFRNKNEGVYVHIPAINSSELGEKCTCTHRGWFDYEGDVCLTNDEVR